MQLKFQPFKTSDKVEHLLVFITAEQRYAFILTKFITKCPYVRLTFGHMCLSICYEMRDGSIMHEETFLHEEKFLYEDTFDEGIFFLHDTNSRSVTFARRNFYMNEQFYTKNF